MKEYDRKKEDEKKVKEGTKEGIRRKEGRKVKEEGM